MVKSPRPNPAFARQFWLACWFALALLSFQTLGHAHRHAHLHDGDMAASTTASTLDSWGHQSGDLYCLLFDQLSQDHAPGGQFLVDCAAAVPLLAAALSWVSSSPAGHWKRGARGPPPAA